MSDHVERTISDVQEQISTLDSEIAEKKKMVNSLCELIGRQPIYHDVESSGPQPGTIRNDQFYGHPLATVARQVLELRKSSMTVADMYEAMKSGGFHFDNKNSANAKRSLRISLSKNTSTFHKLPNGTYGLLEWYPKVKNGSKAKDEGKAEDEAAEVAATDDGFKDEEPTEVDEQKKEEAVAKKG